MVANYTGSGKQSSSPGYAKMKQLAFILRFLHAFNGNECVILYHLCEMGLVIPARVHLLKMIMGCAHCF